jgi:AraC-like DNA-binding protein
MPALMMRIAGLDGYRELVCELGAEPEKLIRDAELEEKWFDLPDHLIPAWKACKLLEISAEALSCPDFGLRLAQKQNLAILGALGIMLQHSETLEQALQDLKRFLHVHSQAGNVELSFNGNLLSITYTPLVSYQDSAKQLIDLSLAVGFSLLSGLSNNRLPVISAYFSYQAPKDKKQYEQYFNCPVIFSSSENGVTISRHVLENSLSQNKSDIRDFFSNYLIGQESASYSSIEESARTLISQLLPLGKCKLEIVSSALSLDKRTFQRRLKENSTSFQELIESERQNIAIKYMKNSDIDLAQISDLLGYSEPSVFSRSFKKWFGLSPAKYIQEKKLRYHHRTTSST